MRMRPLLAVTSALFVLAGAGCSTALPGDGRHPKGTGEGEGEGDTPPAPFDEASVLSADPGSSLPADGIAAFTVTAHLVDTAGHPLPGLTVTFASDLGTLGTPTVSDDAGDATVTLSSVDTGDATVSAVVATDDGDVALTSTITVAFEGCRTAAQAYEQELYPKVFSRCQGCHNELGLARAFGLSYELPFPGVDDWAQRSVDIITPFALIDETTTDGDTLPRIVAKPSQRLDEGHLGGLVITPGSEEDRLIQAFANRLRNPDACAGVDDPAAAALSRVALLSPRETYARAKLALTGDVATPEDLASMPDTEDALAQQLDALMATPAFDERLAEMYADWFLTDRFTKQMGGRRVLNRNGQYTRRFFYGPEGTRNQQCDPATDDCCSEFFSADYCAGKEDALIETLAREPLDLLVDIVKNDRPISDAVTLDHTIVTPLSATFYGFTDAERAAMFDTNPNNDATETHTAKIHKTAFNNVGAAGAGVQYPHAGLLTTQAMLGRWPTTTSNKNRGRAQSLIMRRLLDIDVMKFAEFSTATLPPDADLEQATQEYVACTACHSAVDPLAGLWQHFVGNGQYRKNAPASQLQDMPAPGFLDTPWDGSGDPLQFAAQQVVTHERFPLAMLMPVLQGLCGYNELDNNVDAADPDFAAKSLAVAIQHKIESDLRHKFAGDDGLRVKALVKDIVNSEVFRAGSADGASLTDVEKRGLELAGVGRGVMITPEQLDRKLASIFGFNYRLNRSPTGSKLLLDVKQYRILFGGINYDAISRRFRDPSPVLTRIVERMSNEMSCIGVPQDFAVTDPAQRKLFTLADASDDGDAAVRAQLKRLHALLLDEDVNDGDQELEASVALFDDVLARGRGLIASGDATAQLPTDCRATSSFDVARTPYPADGRAVVRDDPDYIIRAWMAVVSYLLQDPRFFTE